MLGSSSLLALLLLAATPAGAAAVSDATDDGLTRPASFVAPDMVKQGLRTEQQDLPAVPKPLPLPSGLTLEDKSAPAADNQEGIPGLPPLPGQKTETKKTESKKAEPKKPADEPAKLKIIERTPERPMPPPPPIDGVTEPTYDNNFAPETDSEIYVRPDQPGRVGRWIDGLTFDSWLEQGVTINTLSPRDRSNGPIAFNNRSNEYQLNQAYLRLKRDVCTDGDAWDLGGKIDLLYGTDSMYAVSRGLETFDDFSPKWNAQQYGLAMPQMFAEVAVPWGDTTTMKLGHFYSGFAYEAVTPLDNFFYSHSYAFTYGEPFSYTGFIGTTKFGQFSVEAGMTRGWDNWNDNNNALGFVGGINWESENKNTLITLDVDVCRQQDNPSQNYRSLYALVIQQKLSERWQYVIQHDYGTEPGGGIGGSTACWYGIDQYLFYTINERWKAGMRFEWFHDQNGSRVPFATIPTGNYYELTAGVNWKPNEYVVLRPELRYDWTATPGLEPFGDGTRSSQLLLDCDLIVRF